VTGVCGSGKLGAEEDEPQMDTDEHGLVARHFRSGQCRWLGRRWRTRRAKGFGGEADGDVGLRAGGPRHVGYVIESFWVERNWVRFVAADWRGSCWVEVVGRWRSPRLLVAVQPQEASLRVTAGQVGISTIFREKS
jgi:hypothetical protein